MIKIDFYIFICYYLTVALVIFLFFFLSDRRTAMELKSISKDQIWQCPICMYVYFESKASKISACPFCGSFNEKKQAHS